MLRVGLTGGLGSGKTTVAGMFALLGAHVLEADTIGRELTRPGQPVYRELVEHFGQYPDAPSLVLADGAIDRAALAKFVFSTHRLGELNRIVHPAVIAEQERRMEQIFRGDPNAIVVVESALIFEADRSGTVPGWRDRFDKLVLMTAPKELRLARYVHRLTEGRPVLVEQKTALEQDGRRRIDQQIDDEEKIPFCDFVIENSGTMEELDRRVRDAWAKLREAAATPS